MNTTLHIKIFILCVIALNSSNILIAQNENENSKEDSLIALFYAESPTNQEKKIRIAVELISFSKKSGNYNSEIRGKNLLAKYYWSIKNYNNCFKLYSQIINDLRDETATTISIRQDYASILLNADLVEHALQEKLIIRNYYSKEKSYLSLTYTESDIAYLYSKLEMFREAELHYQKAISAAKKWGKYFAIGSTYNSVGVFYKEQNKANKALEYFDKALSIIEEQPLLKRRDSVLIGYVLGNSGSAYYQLGDTRKAIEHLQKDIRINTNCKEYLSMINASLELADVYIKEDQYRNAIKALDAITSIEKWDEFPFSKTQLYGLYYTAHSHLNNITAERSYFEKFRRAWELHDHLKEKTHTEVKSAYMKNAINIQKERLLTEQQLHKKNVTFLKEKEKFNRFKNLMIILFIVIFSITIFAFLRRKIKNNKKYIAFFTLKNELAKEKMKSIELEKSKLTAEVRLKNKDLTDFAIDISRKHELLQKIKEKITGLKTLNPNITEKKVKELLIFVNNQLAADQNLIEFQNNIETVNYKFFEALGEKHPTLTQTDRKIAGLIRLNLSNKEISTLRGVSYKAARVSRYRLRKKMNLNESDNIVEILQKI